MFSLLLTLLLTAAHATQLEGAEVPCPLGGAPVQVFRLISQDSMGGWDSDGVGYSTQGQFRNFEVSTCPNHALALYGRDMELGLSAAQLALVTPLVDQLEARYPNPSALEAWDRHAMAARTYEALGRDDWFLAKAWLKAGWTLRDAAVGEMIGLSGPLLTRQLLLAGEGELKKELPPSQRKLLLFNMARAAHRGGYGAERDALLQQLEAVGALDDAEQIALAKLRTAAELEPGLQEQAMRHLAAVVEGEGPFTYQAHYLLADLLRRTGRGALAIAAYEDIAGDRKAPDNLRALSSYLAAELKGERPWEQEQRTPLTAP
ncbi:MAG: hypothetical protein JXX28_09295 [Deltaproteobacteria bacterium]|nr:hypothetical protein [Deltaproteobacteria bacterium]